jgi:hypothetical protein
LDNRALPRRSRGVCTDACPGLAASPDDERSPPQPRRITIFFHTKTFFSIPRSIEMERQDLQAIWLLHLL